MKYHEFKESLKKKATNLKEIKIGLKEAQRVQFFNQFGTDGEHHPYTWGQEQHFTPEILRRRKLADDAYTKCLQTSYKAYLDYRARHIAISLFRGRTPEQIENNYQDGKWDFRVYDPKKKKWIAFQVIIDKHLKQLRLDNPPKTYYHEFIEESKVHADYMKRMSGVYDHFNKEFTI